MEKRAPRTTKKQLELMIDFINENKIIVQFDKENPNDFKTYNEKWMELSETLNRSGLGPIKNLRQWKRVSNKSLKIVILIR